MVPKAKLWHKDFTLVVTGQIISLFGNAVLRFALPLYILEQSGSPALFGQVSALAFLPMILLSPVGGMIADRVDKQRVMVVLDFITSALVFGYIAISGYFSAIAIVVVLMMALYAIQGAYSPAVQASIPLLVEEKKLVPANAAVNLVNSLSNMLGPVIGGVLYGTFGLPIVLIVSAICFFLSAVMELFIRIPHKKQESTGNMWATVKKDMGCSLCFMFKTKPILAKIIFIMTLFELFASSVLIIGLPVLITQTYALSSQWLGVTQGVMMGGGLVGGVLAGVLAKKLSIKKNTPITVTDSSVFCTDCVRTAVRRFCYNWLQHHYIGLLFCYDCRCTNARAVVCVHPTGGSGRNNGQGIFLLDGNYSLCSACGSMACWLVF